ncbi:MAG TPA: DUF1178 family protein [Burkholderiaceae bacterium]|nr:DUF1178 family protein [Burkholderiaceae bacterium]
MKVFDLCCDADHLFEGWFASQQEFDEQRLAQKIGCPLCASSQIRRRPSAPRLNLGAEQPVAAAMPQPEQLQAALVRATLQVIATTEDVGERFPEEARRIHYKEAPERGIRGVASHAEAEALAQEGVRIMALPFPQLAKEPLQ